MDRQVYEYISQQTNDLIVERKTCAVSGTKFAVFQSDLDFYNKISPTFNGQKFQIPTPTLCPEERQKRRLAWRNERNFFKGSCAFTGRPIITNYNPIFHEQIISNNIWWSDQRDPLDYGRDYDDSQSFFSQISQLRKDVPKIALLNDNNVGSTNCEFCYDILQCKDSYLVNETFDSEYAFYGTEVSNSKFVADCFTTYHSQYCYHCHDSRNLYNCMYVENSNDCSNLLYAFDCKNCQDCIACVGLRNQQYCIFNKQYTKEQFFEEKAKYLINIYENPEEFFAQRQSFLISKPRVGYNHINTDNAIGSNLFSYKDMMMCFDMKESKNCKYFALSAGAKNCMDVTIAMPKEWCYECTTPDNSWKVAFSIFTTDCADSYYLENCYHCKNCFGCIGLRHKQYCILNKQYTKDTYEKIVANIIKTMEQDNERGEFFPITDSPFSYNVSDAMQRFPIQKNKAQELSYDRDDTEIKINIPSHAQTVNAQDLPNNPHDVSDDITTKIIVCAVSGKPYRILKQELELYRKIGNPIPKTHHDIRYQTLLKQRSARTLYLRTCDKTKETMLSVYPSHTPFKVYSQKAYEQEVYG